MNRPDVTEHNVETGEFLVRPMTDKEFEGYQLAAEDDAARTATEQATAEMRNNAITKLVTGQPLTGDEAAAKAAAKQAVLDRLGLTAEEAALLLG